MNIGTKTLLFGCHQFILHPIYTWLGWRKVYGPHYSSLIWIAFIMHDWGLWGMKEFDGPEDNHTVRSAQIVDNTCYKLRLPFRSFWDLHCQVLNHSRFYASYMDRTPSQLCAADKVGTALMPSWLWAILAYLTGEGWVYMDNGKYELNKGLQPRPHTLRALIRFHKEYKLWAFKEYCP